MSKPSLLDRVMREIAPARAVRRMEAKADYDMMAAAGSTGGYGYNAYEATANSRMRTKQAFRRSRGIDEDHAIGAYNRSELRMECRDLWRNNVVARGVVDRFVEYAIWQGIWPDPKTSSDTWNKTAADWWREIYVPTADWRQIRGVDVISLQKMAVSHRMMDGDLGLILLANGQYQAVEAERIATKTGDKKSEFVTEGVQRASNGIVTGYWVSPRKKGGTVDTTKAKLIKRENFIHAYDPDRIDQLRGIPDMATAIVKLKDWGDLERYILNKAKIDGMQQFKRKVKQRGAAGNLRGSYTQTDGNGKNPQKVTKEVWGNVHEMAPGEDLLAFESKTPNREHVGFSKAILQTIAASLDLPYEIMVLIFTEGSFSAQRAAMLHGMRAFRSRHKWVVDQLMTPLWNWRIAKAMKHGELPLAPTRMLGHGLEISQWNLVDWSLPYFDWIDPDKQAKADERRYNMGQTSLKTIIRSQGRDRDVVFHEKASDISAAITEADALNKTHPDENVKWTDIISTGGAQPVAASSDGGTDDGDGEKVPPKAPDAQPDDDEEDEDL